MAPRYRLQHSIGRKSSSVTTGTRMFIDQRADGRSAWAKRWNDLVLRHASDLGGYGTLSEAEISICKRAATLETQLEKWEGEKSTGMPVNIELYGKNAGRLCRLLEMVGIKRLARPVDPTSDLARGIEAYAQKPVDDDALNICNQMIAYIERWYRS